MDVLPSGSLDERGNDTVGLYSAVRSRSEAHLAEDHHVSERLFGMIVRRRHTGDAKEREEALLLRADEVRSQSLGGFESKRMFADRVQFHLELFFYSLGSLPGDSTGFEFLSRIAGPFAEVYDVAHE